MKSFTPAQIDDAREYVNSLLHRNTVFGAVADADTEEQSPITQHVLAARAVRVTNLYSLSAANIEAVTGVAPIGNRVALVYKDGGLYVCARNTDNQVQVLHDPETYATPEDGDVVSYLLFSELRNQDLALAKARFKPEQLEFDLYPLELETDLPDWFSKIADDEPLPDSTVIVKLDFDRCGWYASYSCANPPVGKSRERKDVFITYSIDYMDELAKLAEILKD